MEERYDIEYEERYFEFCQNDKKLDRKRRLELNRLCPEAEGMRNVRGWYIDHNDVLWIRTKRNLYSANNVFGTYAFLTRHMY